MTLIPNDLDFGEAILWPKLLRLAETGCIVRPVDKEEVGTFWDLYAPIAQGNDGAPFVVAQLGQSLDGRIATATGRSHYINGPESIRHLHRLRALVDAVIVGIGAVVADDPQLTVRKVTGRNPARVVIDPNGRLPPDARMLAEHGAPIFVVQGCDQPRPSWVTPITIPSHDGTIDPAAIVAALAALGFNRLLIEGGARTVSGFLAASVIDRLHVCIAPLIIGSGPIGISLPAIDQLDEALRPRTSVHELGRDVLFDCVLRPGAIDCASASTFLDSVER